MDIQYLQTIPANHPDWRKAQEIVSRTIAIDFDGVLHRYSKGWHDGTIYDSPVDGSAAACRRLVADGYMLTIFTARRDINGILKWLNDNEFPTMSVTNEKPPALLYIDDRAIRFLDWGHCLAAIRRHVRGGISDP